MPERTPAEREAARIARERRRRGEVEPDLPAVARTESPPPYQDAQPAYQEARPAYEQAQPRYEAEQAYRAPEPAYEEQPPEPEQDHLAFDDHEPEVASGTRRVGWRERTAAVAPAPATERATPPRRRRSTLVRVGAIVALILAAVLIWFCVELFQPFHGSGHGSVTVTVPPRAGARQVGDTLARDGVVASGFFFYLRATLAGDRGKLLAGTYHLKLGMSYGQALKALTTAPPAARTTNVTVVPGETRAQVNAILRSQGIPGSYLNATRRSPLLNPTAYGAPASTPSLEGFLFPDTYQLREPVTLSALISDQLKTFKQVFAHLNLSYARSRHLTPYDVLIIASIIEKESATRHDDPLVASVIYNRLKDGIPLGMDSTTRYEFNDYTKPLTQSQLAAPSPYNTRLHQGLPPTPISNPGLAAIQAAAQPARTSYLYFVVKPCGNGSSVFSSSYSQFLADSARYQQARAAKGGKSPTSC